MVGRTTKYQKMKQADDPNKARLVWGCHVYLREDGTLEMKVLGETGHAMAMAALDELRRIERLRREPAYSFKVTEFS